MLVPPNALIERQAGKFQGSGRMTGEPDIAVRRERRWSTVGVNPTRELVRTTR
jgi:hypothetical protein